MLAYRMNRMGGARAITNKKVAVRNKIFCTVFWLCGLSLYDR